jgi:hypothetical protein
MTKKRDKPLHLDMSFDEALRRVAQTDPRELPKPQAKAAPKKKMIKKKKRSVARAVPPRSEKRPD